MSNTAALMALFKTAAAQHGVIHFAQARGLGLHGAQIRRLAESQRWMRAYPGVYADPAKGSIEQPLFAAWLWAGREAVVSHRSAALLWGFDGIAAGRPELTVPLRRNPRRSTVLVHRSDLPGEDRRMHAGLPVTSAARTLLDLASVLELEEFTMAVDSAWRRRLVPLDWLERRVRQLGSRGRPGMKLLGRVLRDCRARGKPLDSALEVRLWLLLGASELPLPLPGYRFDDDFGQPGRIDFAYPSERLAIEADGFETHGQREVFERDRDRLSRLAALGWRVIHVTSRQLDSDPERVLQLIASALRGSERPALAAVHG